MVFLPDSEYQYIYKTDFNPNIFLLSKLYIPFISKEAFCLYVFMCEELRNFNSRINTKNKIQDLLNYLDLKAQDFEQIRNNLETFNLLKTYIGVDDQIYFELFEPLNFNKFIANQEYKSNLEIKFGKNAFNKLLAQYQQIKDYQNLKDLSVINNTNNLKNLNNTTLNLDSLLMIISKSSKLKINISEQAKKIISFYHNNHQITLAEIEQSIYSSLIKNKGEYEIDLQLITNELEKHKNKNLNCLKENIKNNHHDEIFIKKHAFTDLILIFANYKNLKPETFLSALLCEELNDIDLKIINTLRDKYQIKDELINIMIDFSIRKTYGSLNAKYLYKMAKSFNLKNINNLESSYLFLLNWSNKKNNNKKNINKNDNLVNNEFYQINTNKLNNNLHNSEIKNQNNLKHNDKENDFSDQEPIFEFDLGI